MSEPIDVAFAINLPPEKAIQYLESKGYAFSFRWEDLAAQAQAKAFTVAGAMKLDLLQTIRGSVEKALKEGKTLQQFKKELTPELQKLGWWGKETEVTNPETREVRKTRVDGFRLRTIYNTNLQSAYMAGRYQSQLEDDFRPYWQYVATMDRRTRPAHAVLNETVLRKEDPFWNENYPPNGWGCRCRVRGLSQSKVDKLGLKIAKGENLRPIADKAFQGNPGLDAVPLDVVAWQKAEKVAESARNAWIADMIRPEQRQQIVDAFVDEVDRIRQNRGMVRTLTYLEPNLFNELTAEKALKSPIVTISDTQVLHAMRNGKNEASVLKRVQDAVNNPEKVWRKNNELVFVKTIENQQVKFVFNIHKRKGISYEHLTFITAGKFEIGFFQDTHKKIR